jgi:ParB-like chromosome segregation protein Spo0J
MVLAKGPKSKERNTVIEQRRIADLRPYPRNARLHSPEQIKQIAAAITEFGWTMPLLIDEDDMILAGHGRVAAAKRLGIETAPVIVARGWSAKQKAAYVIADNRITENAKWDDELLKLELGALQEAGYEVAVLALSAADLRRLGDGAGQDTSPQLAGLSYAVIVRCASESDQRDLLARFEEEGLNVEALIS